MYHFIIPVFVPGDERYRAMMPRQERNMNLIWMNGKLVPPEKASVSIFDHGVLYGDGVFEGLRQYNGQVFRQADHIKRLYASARAIRLDIPYSTAAMTEAIAATLQANNLKDSYIRLIVTRGGGSLDISPATCGTPGVFIIAGRIAMYSEETYRDGMAIITASTPRVAAAALSPRIKSLNYLNNIMAKWEAIDAGVAEAVMLNHLGFICECTADNIFIIRDGQVVTPAEESGILLGITRSVVLELAAQLKIPLKQTNLTRYDLYTADECFLTGTGAEIVPVISVDKRSIGDGKVGPITRQLTEAFHRYARRDGAVSS
jgi:branched-chain amino acid aminotransferase